MTAGGGNIKPTVVVSEDGSIAAGGERTSYRRGFADLLDLAAPPARVAVLPRDEPTAIGFIRTGHAMRHAMAVLAGRGGVIATATVKRAVAAANPGKGRK
jgi:hypothetical protein